MVSSRNNSVCGCRGQSIAKWKMSKGGGPRGFGISGKQMGRGLSPGGVASEALLPQACPGDEPKLVGRTEREQCSFGATYEEFIMSDPVPPGTDPYPSPSRPSAPPGSNNNLTRSGTTEGADQPAPCRPSLRQPPAPGHRGSHQVTQCRPGRPGSNPGPSG